MKCKTFADVKAAITANHSWRAKMFAPEQPKDPEPPPTPEPEQKPEPLAEFIDLPPFIPAVRPEPNLKPTVQDILKRVARFSGFRVADLKAARRTADVVLPRQIAMALAKYFTLGSLPAIGRHFGGRDHTTVLHAARKYEPVIRKIESTIGRDAGLDEWIEAAFKLAKEDNLETAHERRERLARLRAPLMVAAE